MLLRRSSLLALLALLGPTVAARTADRSAHVLGDAMANDRAAPREPHQGRGGDSRSAERVLHRRRERRRVEDDRLRPHLDPDFRRPADRLDRRDRARAVEPEHHLRRKRRGTAAPRPLDRRRHLQVDRRRQDLDAPRPARRTADSADRRRPARSESAVRRRPGPPVRPERRARLVPLDRRRRDVSESLIQGREHRRDRRRARSRRPRHRVLRALGSAAGSVGERRVLRPGQRIVQIDRRRRRPGGRSARVCRRSSRMDSGASASPSRRACRRGCSRPSARRGTRGLYRSDDAGENWYSATTDIAGRRRARRISPR